MKDIFSPLEVHKQLVVNFMKKYLEISIILPLLVHLDKEVQATIDMVVEAEAASMAEAADLLVKTTMLLVEEDQAI